MLYAVTFPDFCDPAHAERVTTWRQRFDAPHANDVPGHVTLVFGTDTLSHDAFAAHVRTVAATTPSFRVAFAAPLIWPEEDGYYLFAVPEEGLSDVAVLHDRLYSGPLATALRTNLPYLPHMTLGRCKTHADAVAAREAVRPGLPIAATVRALEILDTSDGISNVATVPLGGSA